MTDNEQSDRPDQEFSKESLDAFIAGLGQRAPVPEDMIGLDEEARHMLDRVKPLLLEAMEMDQAGPEADNALAKLLNNSDVCSMILSIAMSPMHTEFEKARIIAAITLIAVREYDIKIA